MTPEQELLADLLEQLRRIAAGAAEDQVMLGEPPATLEAFQSMPPSGRTASKALLKGFEQYVDTLQRVIRTQLRGTGFRLKGLTPLDVANKAHELDQVSDANLFLSLVKLRNELAHEYPDDDETRFFRFSQAIAGMPFLRDAMERVMYFSATRMGDQSS